MGEGLYSYFFADISMTCTSWSAWEVFNSRAKPAVTVSSPHKNNNAVRNSRRNAIPPFKIGPTKIPQIGIGTHQDICPGLSRLLVARARRVLACTANHRAAVEFLPGLSALEKRVCTLQLQQKHPLETPAAFILRLAVHADVNAGVLRFQYFDRNLRASLRRIEECFL